MGFNILGKMWINISCWVDRYTQFQCPRNNFLDENLLEITQVLGLKARALNLSHALVGAGPSTEKEAANRVSQKSVLTQAVQDGTIPLGHMNPGL